MKVEKISVGAAVIIFILLAGGCSRSETGSGPRTALAAYLDALISGHTGEARQYIYGPALAESKSPEGDSSFESTVMLKALSSHCSYEILEVRAEGFWARVVV